MPISTVFGVAERAPVVPLTPATKKMTSEPSMVAPVAGWIWTRSRVLTFCCTRISAAAEKKSFTWLFTWMERK